MIPSCSSIDTGLFLTTQGGVKTCCSGSYDLGSARTDTIDTIFSNPKYIQVKSELDTHQKSKYCSTCDYAETITPGISQRADFNKTWPSYDGSRTIKQIDLRWSNVCNLACRYCDAESSSEWAKIMNEPVETTNRVYIQSILDTVQKNRETIDCAYLLGGEPLLQKHNEALLDILRPETKIDLITNLSVKLDNNRIYQLLKKFPNVLWNLSFDNVGDRFEYVRHGAKWETLVNNINTVINDFGAEHINVLPVYSIWSCTHIAEYYQFIKQFPNLNTVNWQLAIADYRDRLDFSDGFKVFGHGPNVVELAIKEIDRVYDTLPDASAQDFFSKVKNSLQNTTPTPGFAQKFLDWSALLETKLPPSRPFAELWPEINQALLLDMQ